jgi:hypothetical protein
MTASSPLPRCETTQLNTDRLERQRVSGLFAGTRYDGRGRVIDATVINSPVEESRELVGAGR